MDDQPSADYPLGGSLEPYDIERDKEIMGNEHPVILEGHDPEKWVGKARITPDGIAVTLRDGYDFCAGCDAICEQCHEHHPHIQEIV